MTEWKTVQGNYNDGVQPPEIDLDSSPTTVYERKNFRVIEVEDDMNEGQKTQMWEYEERTYTQLEYTVAILTADKVTLRHENDIIDEYTEQLIEEGVI